MKQYRKLTALLLAAALLLLSLAGCGGAGTDTGDAPDTTAKPTDDAQPEQGNAEHSEPAFTMEDYTLRPAGSYEEIGAVLSGVVSGESYSSAENVGIVDEFFSGSNRPAFAGNYGESSNNTRVLPEGVTRADTTVFADGYSYRVQNGELTILEAKGKESKIVSTTTVTSPIEGYESYEESAQAVAVRGNFAAVMTYVYAWSTTEAENGEWSSETVSQTHMKLFDISDKAAPKQVSDYVQDGSFDSAYLADGKLYLVTDYYVINLDVQDTGTFIPKAGAREQTAPLKAEKILLNDQTDTAQFVVVSALAMDTGAALDAIAVTGSFQPSFAAADTMYLSGWCYAVKQSDPYEENQYQVTDFYSHAITLVVKFRLTDGIAMEKSACVNGRLADENQIDYDNGYLRIGTMAERYTNRLFEDESMGFANLEMGEHFFSNEVYVLDQEMNLVGKLTGLSDSCLTYYQRFIGTTGYVLAYDLDNTVYTLDLTDPTAPAMGESLSAGDPAEILLRCGDQLLGLTAGGKLQLLTAGGAALETVAEGSIGENYPTIRYYLDSILVDSGSGIVVLPGTEGMVVYRVAEGTITQVGTVNMTVNERTRTLLADGLVYIAGDDGYTVVDPAKAEILAQVTVAVG